MSDKVRTEYEDYNIIYGEDTIPKYFKNLMMGLFQVNGCASQLW